MRTRFLTGAILLASALLSLAGTPGTDIIQGSDGNDTILGNGGDDADLIYGLSEDDALYGDAGISDLCNGGPNLDTVSASCDDTLGIP